MRCDLRDEFAMADEAFALSPISARATLPSEADYDAIREAFMETARGRWFLGEYGKRNRNADTSMVLDAVARIEATIAAQKQVPTNELPNALVLIRAMIGDAKASALKTMSGSDAEAALDAVNKGTRIIREISWTLREYGTDARICDMLDAQVSAIDASHRQTIAAEKRDAVLAAFDLLIRQIGELGGGAASPSSIDETGSSPSSASRDEATAETEDAATPPIETASGAAAQSSVDVAALDVTALDVTALDVTALDLAAWATPVDIDTTANETPEPTTQQSETTAAEAAGLSDEHVVAAEDTETAALDLETTQDLAVLDAIALEMAEPDMADFDLAEPPQFIEGGFVEAGVVEAGVVEAGVVEASPVEPRAVELSPIEAAAVEPVAIEPAIVEAAAAETAVVEPGIVEPGIVEPAIVEQSPETALVPAAASEMPSQPSLGASLIASGIVSGRSSTRDALAPFRRMSQAERIAFFS